MLDNSSDMICLGALPGSYAGAIQVIDGCGLSLMAQMRIEQQ
jgi:hypothetical protein